MYELIVPIVMVILSLGIIVLAVVIYEARKKNKKID